MTQFFGMKKNPFDKHGTGSKEAFTCTDHIQMQQRLRFLVKAGGLGVFTAPPGMGKTYALRCFVDELNPTLYTTAYVNLTTVGLREFYSVICEALGLETAGRRCALFSRIHSCVTKLRDDSRKPLILTIDEAQHLHPKILDDLKLLMNFDYDSRNCFTLILLGEPQLNRLLSRPSLESLRQRITVHYNFRGLTPEETHRYVLHKLGTAGASPDIVDSAFTLALHGISHGNPRQTDRLMTQALRLAAQQDISVLTSDILMAADASMALS